MAPKRKAFEELHNPRVENKKSRVPYPNDSKSALVPVEQHKLATKGERDNSKFRILFKDSIAGEIDMAPERKASEELYNPRVVNKKSRLNGSTSARIPVEQRKLATKGERDTIISDMAPKRKATEELYDPRIENKKSRLNGSTSALIPVEQRKLATKGERDDDMLRMLCKDQITGEMKELHFKKIVHAKIDWNDKSHVVQINAWRNQIYGRAGYKNKSVVMWSKDEEAYIELYWHLLIVEANKRGTGIIRPLPRIICEDFNAFFKGKVFYAPGGDRWAPRTDRERGPFTSKCGRLAKGLRSHLEKKMRGNRGESFYPKINQEMLFQYMKLKADLVELGCKDTKIIPWNEVEENNNTADYVLRCRKYLANLPDQNKVELGQPEEDQSNVELLDSEEQTPFDNELLELVTEPEKEAKGKSMNIDPQLASASDRLGPCSLPREDHGEVTAIITEDVMFPRNQNLSAASREVTSAVSGGK